VTGNKRTIKNRLFGIYGKVFFYTMAILALVLAVVFAFFSSQIWSAVETTQRRHVASVFQSLMTEIRDKSPEETKVVAEAFHRENKFFNFRLEAEDGTVLFQTDGFAVPGEGVRRPPYAFSLTEPVPIDVAERFEFHAPRGDGAAAVQFGAADVRLIVGGPFNGNVVYIEFLGRLPIAFGLIFAASIAAAALFAGRITKPIRCIAADARRMAALEPVGVPARRTDEIGLLAADVHQMYKQLQATIRQLETEITREKEMEENQRYFFAAASHELKTPVAAVSALLEGMLEGVVQPEEYPDCLRRCMKIMAGQSRLVSEILEIVAMSHGVDTVLCAPLKLRQLTDGALAHCRVLSEARAQTITIDVPPALICVVNEKLFVRALSNVLTNAVQNTPNGGEIRIAVQDKGGNVELRVLNTGAGLAESSIPKLFEPFARLDDARGQADGRTGLGLTIVKKALDAMAVPFGIANAKDGVVFWMELKTSGEPLI